MTSELTLLVLRLGFLAVLWIFVFSIIYALRSDLFGTRASEYQRRVEAQSRQQTFAGADSNAPSPVLAGAAGAAAGAAAAGANASSDAPTTRTPIQQPSPQPTPGNAVNSRQGAGTAHRRPRIHVTSGPKRGIEVLLGNEPLTIGRAPESGFVIQDDYTSTRHAKLLNWDGSWIVQDLDSTNGTYVGGRRITQPTPLHPGIPVRIGTTTFELRDA